MFFRPCATKCRQIDPSQRWKRGLLSLLRRREDRLDPDQAQTTCRHLVRELLARIQQLKEFKFASLVTLGETLDAWKEEIARMWRFRKNNVITKGFHNKMEMISRRAFGFKNLVEN